MSTYVSTFDTDQQAEPNYLALPASVWNAVVFWLPLLTIGIAMFGVQHNWSYSAPSYIEGKNFLDLVAEVGNSSLSRQVGLLTIGTMGAGLIMLRSRQQIDVIAWLACPIIVLAAWMIMSAMWSHDPDLSLKRSLQPLLLMVGAVGVAKHWTPRQLCVFTAILTGSVLLLGIAAAILQRSFLLGEVYRFTGTMHSNLQATNCTALCLATLTLFLDARKQPDARFSWLWLIPFSVGLLFLFLTRSRTATTAFLVALVPFFLWGASLQRKLVIGYILLMIAAACGIFLLTDDGDTRGLLFNVMQMGREDDVNDATSLTGRIPVWHLATHDIAEEPLLGYGYGAYWTPQRVLDYSSNCHWEPTHAHSAYLESLLNVGVIGLMLGLMVVGLVLCSAVRNYKLTDDAGYRFIAAMLTMALFHGILDSNFVLVGFDSLLVMMCIAIVMLHGRKSHVLAAGKAA